MRHIILNATKKQDAEECITIIIPPGATEEIHEEIRGGGTVTARIVLICGAGAHVTWQAVNASRAEVHVQRDITVKKNATAIFSLLDAPQKNTDNTITVTLAEEHARIKLLRRRLGAGVSTAIATCTVLHQAAHTHSIVAGHTVLADAARESFRMLTDIAPHAHQARAFQTSASLVLSAHARLSVSPDLQIKNGSVACGHKATVTHLDEEKLFYLMSRGMDTIAAREEYIKSFIMHPTGDPACARLIDGTAAYRVWTKTSK